ncbi:ATP-dependent DNA helicase [Trichonephila clavipes]|nr:ATP-dependent DNA helicase [Trichonephila clavipes]
MIDLLVKGKIFGCVRCFMYSVEWQKRGLPHAHILIWIETKIRDEQIDDVIRAELPDQEVDPELFDVVKTHMVHGPCGSYNPRSPCMKNGICSKRFPKPFSTETVTGEGVYQFYCRRSPENSDLRTTIQSRTNCIDIDNRWIVPFSPVLSRTFRSHINVELCSSIKSIKYICKYVNKGSDLAVFGVQNANDEVTSYQNGRHISTSEAIWRMLSFSIHERFPAVTHLDIHLENGPRIYFDPSNVRTVVENPRNTTLMAFFDYAIETNSLPLYCMKKYQVITHLINKMGHSNGDAEGPTSFESLKSVNGILCPTYQAACLALGLLEGDNPWCDTLTDASISTSVSKLRELFAIILVFCNVSNPSELWSKFKDHFTEDYIRDFQRHYPDADINAQLENFSNRVLFALQDVLLSIGGNTLPHYGLPSPQAIDGIVENLNREYFKHTNFDPVELQHIINQNEPRLNKEQNQVYRLLTDSVNANAGGVYFLDAPCGTGKTFLINLLLAKIRSEKKIAIAVASSGIAATLLHGGKTAHSMFEIPLESERMENPVCSVTKNSDKAKVLQDCVFVVWDECTMANKISIEAVNTEQCNT